MTNNKKAYLSILIMSLVLFLPSETRHFKPIADFILEAIGIRTWTGGSSGLHLTSLYFTVLFFLSLFFVIKYAVHQANFKFIKIVVVSIIFAYCLNGLTSGVFFMIKQSSEDLQAIAFFEEDSEISYSYSAGNLVKLHGMFELKNYSDEDQKFDVSFTNKFNKKRNIDPIVVINKEGLKAMFTLKANENKVFTIDLDNHSILGGIDFENGSGAMNITEIILTNEKGQRVILSRDYLNGLVIEK